MVTGGDFTYDGKSHDATGSVIGVNGVPLGTPTIAYTDAGGHAVTDPVNTGTYIVTASYVGGVNYTPASATATIIIDPAKTVFSGLSSPTLVYGTTSIALSGKVASNAMFPSGAVAITISGIGLAQSVTLTAQIGLHGSFVASLPTRSLAAGSYTISYSFAGNATFTAASVAGTLTVAYATRLLFDNTHPVGHGGVLAAQLQVMDAGGKNLSSQSLPVTATGLAGPNGKPVPLKAKGNNPNDLFLYNKGLGMYEFDLDLSGLAAGNYTLYFTVGTDPTRHAMTFTVA
jgi:hypothetical protein